MNHPAQSISIVPLRSKDRVTVAIVVHPSGMERLKAQHPGDFNLGFVLKQIQIDPCTHAHSIDFLICYEEDINAVVEAVIAANKAGDTEGATVKRWLQRGYKWTPADAVNPDNMARAIEQAGKGPVN